MIAHRLAATFLSLTLIASPALAQEASSVWRHGLSLFGDVKYPESFSRFDYVNPDAPKGGRLNLSAIGTFDSFNITIPRGNVAAGLGLIYETLMTPSLDEPYSEYGLIAEAMTFPGDFSSVTFRLRPQARWHDGTPITAADVMFSLEVLRQNHPQYAGYYRNVVKSEAKGDHEVTFTFERGGNRELPHILGQLLVLPKHYWEGTDADGNRRDITKTTLEPPLGSGPYRIRPGFQPGRSITYERVKDYWGETLPVRVGTHNFDEMTYLYFRDSDVALEAFKAGQYDFRAENIAKNWATAYDFPARREGRVVLETSPIRDMGLMQAFVLNTRRDKFKDPRVRRAFNLAMNFEDMNRALFYGQYTRIQSFFQNTELASSGLPEGRELEILQEVKDAVPPEVFTTPYTNPVANTPEELRNNLREAVKLLAEAGWTVKPGSGGRVLSNGKGEPMEVEFLLASPSFERVVLSYIPNLERLGIKASVRTVDPSQYENRLNDFNFDITVGSWPQSLSPGNEQRDFWGSAAADRPGSRNLIGVKNPAIDRLIERLIHASDRDDLIAATRALDRVLLWNHYVVPQWTTGSTRFAYWTRLQHPKPLPEYDLGFPTIWWAGAGAQPATTQ